MHAAFYKENTSCDDVINKTDCCIIIKLGYQNR